MLVLFDIDGTLLIRGADAHREALYAAIADVWGSSLAHIRVETGGRTDLEIAREILLEGGVDAKRVDDGMPAFRESVVIHYSRRAPDDLSDRVAPGALAVLEQLAADSRTHASLVTGNIEGVAWLKLKAAGIARFFAHGQGGFGSDSEDRADLPAVARLRAASLNGGEPWPRSRTVVVGDTPRDIACARADGVRCVAVPTGPYTWDDLKRADVVIDSLAELPEALARL